MGMFDALDTDADGNLSHTEWMNLFGMLLNAQGPNVVGYMLHFFENTLASQAAIRTNMKQLASPGEDTSSRIQPLPRESSGLVAEFNSVADSLTDEQFNAIVNSVKGI